MIIILSDIKEMKHYRPSQFVTLKVKSFSILREIIGKEQMTLLLPRKDEATTVADLRVRLLELYPAISAQRIVMAIAVNAKIANDKSILNNFDEIALLPPISGG